MFFYPLISPVCMLMSVVHSLFLLLSPVLCVQFSIFMILFSNICIVQFDVIQERGYNYKTNNQECIYKSERIFLPFSRFISFFGLSSIINGNVCILKIDNIYTKSLFSVFFVVVLFFSSLFSHCVRE